jgi:hypothetical protein
MLRTACLPKLLPLSAAFVACAASAETLVVIPDTHNDRVWAFSAFDGTLVSSNFIPSDGRMEQVMQIAQTPQGTLVMADPGTDLDCSADDAVREYTACGQYIRTLASPADGVCNPEGICIAYGKIWFTRQMDPSNEVPPARSALWSINYDGTGLTESCARGDLGKIWGLLPHNGGFIVSDGTDDNLEFVPLDCSAAAPFHDSDGLSGIDFPQQAAKLSDGWIVAAGFTAPYGLYFYDSTGNVQYLFPGITSPRGVFELGNGEILYTGGTRVMAYNPNSAQERTIVDQLGTSFRWISTIDVCREDLDCSGDISGGDLGVLLGNWGTSGRGDLDNSGSVNGADLGLLLAQWGACG